MKLIALLAGLLIERLATQLFHLRQLRWLDSIIDAGFARAQRLAGVPPLISVLVLATLLVLPLVFVLTLFGDVLFDFGFLLIAIVVLFFSLGPKDIGEEVDDYCISLEKGDEELIRQTAKALLEDEPSDDRDTLVRDVEAAVCIQSNNRLFAVIFWFVLLGPIGAWSYRVTDLIRRRAVFNAVRCESIESNEMVAIEDAASRLHGWLAWIPARITALGFALAGSFDDAIAAWRKPAEETFATAREESERLLARVGCAALALQSRDGETSAERGVRGATAANGLVFRLLGIWAVIIAALTLYGWAV